MVDHLVGDRSAPPSPRSPGGPSATARRGATAARRVAPPPAPADEASTDVAAGRARLGQRLRELCHRGQADDGRPRLLALVVVAIVVAVVAAGVGALRSPLLAVRQVRVVGAVSTPVPEVTRAAALDHRLMMDVRAHTVAQAVDRLAWVAHASVSREWPSTVKITVRERSPVAIAAAPADRAGAGPSGPDAATAAPAASTRAATVLVDGSGRALGPAPSGTALPVIEVDPRGGAAASLPRPGTAVGPAYRPGLTVAAALPRALIGRVVTIAVGADGGVRLALAGGASAIIAAPTDLGPKLGALTTILDQTKSVSGTIDVRVPAAPVLTGVPPGG